jgi:ectoine hydroxylase-related dioxygenase (phytanoyl-CoA dioxygenase family)
MTATALATDKHRQLIDDGFCVVEGVLDAAMLGRLKAITERMIARQPAEHFREQVTTGSLIDVADDAELADLIAYPPALAALRSMGFEHIVFQSGYVISKPPHSPPLFWHQDWTGWNSACSYRDEPHQLFLMYYLVDTNRKNGCLRVIPGSHRQPHRLHTLLAEAHTDTVSRRADPSRPEFQQYEDEADVPVKAGDLVIGDSRVLHAAHGNDTDQRRTLVTLWYHPIYNIMPDDLKAYLIQRKSNVSAWPAAAQAKIRPIEMTYTGTAQPCGFNRHADITRMRN